MNFFLATDIGEEISEKVSENSTEKVSELSKLFDGFSSKMISLGINIINAVIIFIIGKIIIKLLRKLSKKIIGRTSADKILAAANVNPDTRVRDLTDEEVGKIRDIIDEHYMVEGDLRRETALNIKRLQEIGCYRGIRHRKGLPVRGQKTKTNARTRKGPKRTVANKKK